MSAANVLSRPAAFTFTGLASFRHEEVALWNLFHRLFPGEADWRNWAGEAFAHLLMRPSGERVSLEYRSALEPNAAERRFALNKDEISIGRAPENDIVLAEKAIGRRHARIIRRAGQPLLEDLGSQFGLHMGARRLQPNQPERLRDGDRFTIFPYEFRVAAQVEWEPESAARIAGNPARSATWDEFQIRSAAGSVLFPVFLHPSDQPVYLEAGSAFLIELVRRLLQPLGVEKREPSLLPSDQALIEFALLSVLEIANRAARFPFRVELGSSRRPPPCDPECRGVSLSFSVGLSNLSGAFRLFVPYATLAGVDAVALRREEPQLSDRISWPVTISAGWVDLAPPELAALEIRDILLYSPQPAVFLPGAFEKGWRAVVEADNPWRVRIDNYFDGSVRMQETTGPEPGRASGPDLTALPVRLHVVVGEKEMTLAEIANLAPNTILELGAGKADPVRLAVNGKIIGQGELVEVDGKLGVRILSWS